MTNNNDPIAPATLADARDRRAAYWAAAAATPMIPNDRPARRTPPAQRRTRRTSVRHRSIR